MQTDVTLEWVQGIIDYNTIGKGKGDPNYTALVNARRWKRVLERLLEIDRERYKDGLQLPYNDITLNGI